MARAKGTKHGKLNICKFKQNAKQKLDDLNETIAVDETLQKHYEFLLANFEAMQEKLDIEIAVIQQQKDEMLEQYIAAPEKLVELAKHIAEISAKAGTTNDAVTHRKQKESKAKRLREQLEKLEKEIADMNIDVADVEAKIQAEAEEAEAKMQAAAEKM